MSLLRGKWDVLCILLLKVVGFVWSLELYLLIFRFLSPLLNIFLTNFHLFPAILPLRLSLDILPHSHSDPIPQLFYQPFFLFHQRCQLLLLDKQRVESILYGVLGAFQQGGQLRPLFTAFSDLFQQEEILLGQPGSSE